MTGMTVGWGWGREAAGVGDNHITANIVESVMSTYCWCARPRADASPLNWLRSHTDGAVLQ